MELEKAIELLKNVVKENGTNDMKHLDLTLIPTQDKPLYEKALITAKLAIIEGKISQDELFGRIHLNN